MPVIMSGGVDWNNILTCAVTALCILIFLTAYYFIRKSVLPNEDFNNKILSTITPEDKKDSLLYCISFFQDAYDSSELPGFSEFMELRIRVSIVFTFYKKVKRAAYVYMKLKEFYYKGKPLPDVTDKYLYKLQEDGRSSYDAVSAFCLLGVEEFSKITE